MYYKILPLSILILFGFCACSKPVKVESKPQYITETEININSNRIAIKLPNGYVDLTNTEIWSSLISVNPHLLFLAFSDTTQQTNTFSVSKYWSDVPISIDSAFNITVNSVATFAGTEMTDSYKLIDFGTYQLNGKLMRYKISSTNDSTINTMYYFMKDDFSTELYEIKIIASKAKFKGVKSIIENVALSFTFM